MNKYFDTRICVSETTLALCAWPHRRPIGRLVLKGKSEGLGTYELLTATRAQAHEIVEYAKAYRLVESCDPAAGKVFAELTERYPDDGLIAFYATRLEAGITGVTIRLSRK